MRGDDAVRDDLGATRLGQLARTLDGSASAADDAAGRDRVLTAIETARRKKRPLLPFAAAAAILAGALFAVSSWRTPESIGYDVSGSSMRIEGEWLDVPADRGAGLVRFSEGTEIELAPGSHSRVAEVTPDGAHIELATGTLRARVVHKPRASWRVGAGPYSIDVTGTAFDVEWSTPSGRFEVRLHHGSVVVRGPSLPDGIRLLPGQRLVAHARTGDAELSSLSPPAPEARAVVPQPVEPPPPAPPVPAVARPAASWSDLLASGNFRAVLAQAHTRGIELTLRRASLADLVALSDAARYSGVGSLARRGLLAQRSRFSGSAEAHAAAFLLGRMADDEGAPQEALRWYEVYLRQAPHGDFAAEALGRKLVVLVRAEDLVAARGVAELYVHRFPRGAHAEYAREVLSRP